MSDEFIVYHQAQDSEEFVVNSGEDSEKDSDDEESEEGPDQLLESEELENFINDVFYSEFLEQKKGAKFISSMISWLNYHMPFDKKVTTLEGDMRDGLRFCALINRLNIKIDLPNPIPSDEEEKRENIYYILSFLAKQQENESDPEVFEVASEDIIHGDVQAILSLLLNIIRHHVIDSMTDPMHDHEGLQLLEYWAMEVVGMSGLLFCSDFMTTHIESYSNLEKLANHLKIEVPAYLDFLSPEEKSVYMVEWFEKETGIPPLIDISVNMEDGDPHLFRWYHVLRFLWLAEMYKFSLNSKKRNKVGEDKKPTTPQDIILTAIYSADKVETKRGRLVKYCKELIEWSQEKISVMKKEVADIETASDIGSRSVIQLADIYKLMREEQQLYSSKKIDCYKLHCDVLRKLTSCGNEEFSFDPKYNVHKVEDLWNKMVKLEHSLEKKIEGYLLRAENKNAFFNQWKHEVSYVQQWMLKWEEHITRVDTTLKDLGSCELRKCVKVFNKFGSDIDEQDQTKQARLLCSLLVEFSIDGEEQDTLVSKTNNLCVEYRQFLKDARQFIKKLIAHQEKEGEMEVMYSEMADLMSKLDGQIHELHTYYSSRPELHSVSACNKLSCYVRDTWNVLFEISWEVDAVISLWQDIEVKKLDFGENFPKNHFTSFNPKYILQRWSRLLEEARYMEEYIYRQRATCLLNQPLVEKVTAKLDDASEFLKSKISEINICLSRSSGNIMETGRDRSPVTSIMRLRGELCDFFESSNSMSEITDELPNSGVFDDAFTKVAKLNECYSYCLATIDLLVSGHDTYPALIQEEGMVHDVEEYQNELNCAKENNQLLPRFENVVKLFADEELREKTRMVKLLKQEVDAIDPEFNRVPLSAWINMRRDDIAKSHLSSCSKTFKDCFAKISQHDEAILMEDLVKHVDPELMPFVQKHITEYFGNDDELESDAYDYQRLIAHLTGKKKKLPVAVEYA